MKKNGIQESRKEHSKSKYLIAVYYIAAGITGAITLAAFIISGGMLPNSNSGIQSPSATGSTVGTEPGMLYGYVEGLSGLPAIGSTVIAEDRKQVKLQAHSCP